MRDHPGGRLAGWQRASEPPAVIKGQFKLRLQPSQAVGAVDMVKEPGVVNQSEQRGESDRVHFAFLKIAAFASQGDIAEAQITALCEWTPVIETHGLDGDRGGAILAGSVAVLAAQFLAQKDFEVAGPEWNGAAQTVFAFVDPLLHGAITLANQQREFAAGAMTCGWH